MKIKQAVILAGGKGERLRPLTNTTPKPLILVNSKPILEYSIDLLVKYGVQEIVLAIGHDHEKIQNYFKNGDPWHTNITYSIESKPLGTAGAVKNLESQLDPCFFMMNGDNISNFDLNQMELQHKQTSASGTLTLFKVSSVLGSGRVTLDHQKIISFEEKPTSQTIDQSCWINAGTYILEKEVFSLISPGFNLIEKTIFPELAVQGRLFGFKHTGFWYSIDTFEKLTETEKALKNRFH